METHFRAGDISGEPLPTRVDRRHLSSITEQNMSLRDRFELDRPHSSHGDNRKARNYVSSSSMSSSGNRLKQQTRRVNATDNDELVKHMSNLPSYLERAVKPQEKAFSVGVLDWGLLEKWQSNKQVPCRSDGSSSSNSITSSLFSTEESSTCSQAGHSSAASRHRYHQFSTEASMSVGKSHNVRKNQSGSTVESNPKVLNSSSTTPSSKTAYPRGNDPQFSSKGQSHSDLKKQVRRSTRSQSMSLNHKYTEKDENPALVRPLDDCSTGFITKGPKATTTQRNLKDKELNSTERCSKAHDTESSCNILHSRPIPCDSDDQKIRVLRPCRSHEAKSNDEEIDAVPQLGSSGKLVRSLKEGSSKDNHCFMKTELLTVAGMPQGSRILEQPVEAANARDLSPNGRFSLRLGSRKSSFAEDAEFLQKHAVDKPYAIREADTSSIENPIGDKSAAAGKARSSPLKRLLEPLLKPREATNYRSHTSLKKDSKPVDSATKMLDRPSAKPGIQVSLNLNVHQNGNHNETTVVQALLQVVVQNGCPLFTFAVDSVKDILCAALSKLGSDRTSGDSYLYTFFSIQEIKNKSWMNLRGKGSGHEYSHNIVAQMEVSESRLTKSTGNNFLRQFVLSAVDLKPGDKSESEYQINDELAALVVCLPGMADDKMQSNKYNSTTVILPGGIHTLPSNGKPSSLTERWRSGGQCDCGGWDPGCKLRILSDSEGQPTSSAKFKLYDKGGVEGNHQPIFTMAPFKGKEGVLSISFSSSISPLQAFSICLAVLDSRKLLRPPTPTKIQEAKSSDRTTRVEPPDSYFSFPPHSPVGRV